ncbi:hypothetical protein [Candidatus Solirubrobacter pratensis]|uniref:hypothetical protein n=1 Tax=Candidatus Solirubrobacter pratensis TaxID=1298857 RepID=UPI000406ECA8|nr:hypothetical protein [Candidatus Solirubrobacter pratensis]
MLKNTQIIVLAFGLVAAVLGIYAAQESPYTHIAAGAVAIAAVVAAAQAVQAAREADFVKQILSHLARSTPVSAWWRKRVNELVRTGAASRGYLLDKILFDSSDGDDPAASAIFVFRSADPPDSERTGLLVLTPADYAELSLTSQGRLPKDVAALMTGSWAGSTEADVAARLCQTATALYGLSTRDGFRVSLTPHSSSTPLTMELGSLRLSFSPSKVAELVAEAPIRRDDRIASAIEAHEPDVARYLQL